ncbi:MAG: MATE family efflux transporter, partial [Dehalococcoidales bacterium]|nr:MATE family efflux transporter [Dehalococcoidales bacterium]
MVAISLYNLVNAFWVAKLGNQALAALTILMPFWVIAVAIGAGTGVGANALASRRFGERKVEEANKIAGQTLFLTVILGGILVILIHLLARQILTLCGAPSDTIELGKQYLLMLGWGMPFLFFNTIMRGIYHASGDTLRPMIFTVISQVCNAILDPFLIFGWGIFPEMGVRGAALASVISMAVGVSLVCYHLFSKRSAYRLKPHHFMPNWRVIFSIYRVGLPSILMEGAEGVVFGIFFHVVGTFGSVVVAGVGIAGRISDLAFMFIIGIGQGLLPIIGFSYGAKLWKRLWGAVKIACLWLVAIMAIATIGLEIFTPQVIRLFSSDPELLKISVPGMRIFLSTLVLYGPTVVFITTFQGLSKGVHAMVLAFTRQALIFVPAIILLAKYMGMAGVWIALPISDIFGFVAAGLWILLEYRRQKKSGIWLETTTQKTL